MSLIEALNAEIERQIAISHPMMVVEALEAMLEDIRQSSDGCSYNFYFAAYRNLRIALSALFREDAIGHGYHSDYQHWGKTRFTEGSWERRLGRIEANVREIKAKRYENPCFKCSACQTRRKRWPAPGQQLQIFA
jgi:hypothetical protein